MKTEYLYGIIVVLLVVVYFYEKYVKVLQEELERTRESETDYFNKWIDAIFDKDEIEQ